MSGLLVEAAGASGGATAVPGAGGVDVGVFGGGGGGAATDGREANRFWVKNGSNLREKEDRITHEGVPAVVYSKLGR